MRTALLRTHELSLVYGIEHDAGQVERREPLLELAGLGPERGQHQIARQFGRHGERASEVPHAPPAALIRDSRSDPLSPDPPCIDGRLAYRLALGVPFRHAPDRAPAPCGEVARGRRAELVREAAIALGSMRADGPDLVVACRRIVERHPEIGALWWLCARLLISDDPSRLAWQIADEIGADPTPRVDRLRAPRRRHGGHDRVAGGRRGGAGASRRRPSAVRRQPTSRIRVPAPTRTRRRRVRPIPDRIAGACGGGRRPRADRRRRRQPPPGAGADRVARVGRRRRPRRCAGVVRARARPRLPMRLRRRDCRAGRRRSDPFDSTSTSCRCR